MNLQIPAEREPLVSWGWNSDWEAQIPPSSVFPQIIGRVVLVQRDRSFVHLADQEINCNVTGKFRHFAANLSDFPCVGDWVEVEKISDTAGLIHAVLPRKTVLSRKEPGPEIQEHVLASNVDVAFVVTDFGEDFKPRRLERYVVLARQGGIEPVILVNKADLADNISDYILEARDISPQGEVFMVSAKTGQGLEGIRFLLEETKTGVFVGSSGVGKSTLINRMLGEHIQRTDSTRKSDGKGRHTTTTRQMFRLGQGGLLIDTPGLREIQLWAEEDISEYYR